MRTATVCAAAALALALAVSAAAVTTDTRFVPSGKESRVHGVNVPGGRVGGETIETATVIPALPFTEAANTCSFVDDYDEMCPYGSNSPDCVYAFTPASDMIIDINLCLSEYDTKVIVYQAPYSPGYSYACNDDNIDCEPPVWMYQSWIRELPLSGGTTYYIVIDGYGGDCGDYLLDIYEVEECVVECPPDAIMEGEEDCYDGYVDMYNAGCNSAPESYVYVECSNETITYCGTSGVYDVSGQPFRDTDWYMLTLDVPMTVTVGVIANFEAILGLVDLSAGCANATFYDYVTALQCDYQTLTYELPAGETPVFVSTEDWNTSWECGSVYYITIDGYSCVSPVEETSWGAIKAIYR